MSSSPSSSSASDLGSGASARSPSPTAHSTHAQMPPQSLAPIAHAATGMSSAFSRSDFLGMPAGARAARVSVPGSALEELVEPVNNQDHGDSDGDSDADSPVVTCFGTTVPISPTAEMLAFHHGGDSGTTSPTSTVTSSVSSPVASSATVSPDVALTSTTIAAESPAAPEFAAATATTDPNTTDPGAANVFWAPLSPLPPPPAQPQVQGPPPVVHQGEPTCVLGLYIPRSWAAAAASTAESLSAPAAPNLPPPPLPVPVPHTVPHPGLVLPPPLPLPSGPATLPALPGNWALQPHKRRLEDDNGDDDEQTTDEDDDDGNKSSPDRQPVQKRQRRNGRGHDGRDKGPGGADLGGYGGGVAAGASVV